MSDMGLSDTFAKSCCYLVSVFRKTSFHITVSEDSFSFSRHYNPTKIIFQNLFRIIQRYITLRLFLPPRKCNLFRTLRNSAKQVIAAGPVSDITEKNFQMCSAQYFQTINQKARWLSPNQKMSQNPQPNKHSTVPWYGANFNVKRSKGSRLKDYNMQAANCTYRTNYATIHHYKQNFQLINHEPEWMHSNTIFNRKILL